MKANPLAPLSWQQSSWQQLYRARQAGRGHHALLLRGPAGIGKRQFGHALAASLLCQQVDEQGVACGECRACKHVMAATHPDWFELGPEQDKGQIKVDQLREMIGALALTPALGGYRVALLQPAEAMNVNAANSLLKTLEEPGANTLLVLVSERASALPATLRSRCQQLAMAAPSEDEALDWLEGRGIERSSGLAKELLDLAGGAPLRAYDLADHSRREAYQSCFEQFVALLEHRVSPFELAQRWLEQPLDWLLERQLAWLVDMLRLKAGARPERCYQPAHAERLGGLVATLSAEALYQRYDDLNGLRRLNTVSLNSQMVLEDQLIAWANLFSANTPRAAVIRR